MKGGGLGDRVDKELKVGSDGWTRKVLISEAARAALVPALAFACYATKAAVVVSSGCGHRGGLDMVYLVSFSTTEGSIVPRLQ